MAADPIRDARWALSCAVREQEAERFIIRQAQIRLDRAIEREIAARSKLEDLGAEP